MYVCMYVYMYHILSSCKWSIYHTARNGYFTYVSIHNVIYFISYIKEELNGLNEYSGC